MDTESKSVPVLSKDDFPGRVQAGNKPDGYSASSGEGRPWKHHSSRGTFSPFIVQLKLPHLP
jgi:hypothetical protein